MQEEELKAYWKTVVETIQEGVMIVDPNGSIVAVNQALSELTGFGAEELIGRSCATLNCATCRAKRDQEGHHWCSLFELGRMNKQRCAVLRRDGRYVQVLKNASVLKNDAGEVIGGVETLTDISGLLERDTAIEAFRRELSGRDTFHGMVGRSAVMQRVYDLIDNAADSDAPLAISGESGTGKELAARRCTSAASDALGLTSRSTAPPSTRRCWRVSSSAMCAAPSPAPTRAGQGVSRQPTAAASFWMRSATCPWSPRSNCCGFWRKR